MKECKFCKKHLNDNEMTCGYCGYDFKTGAMDPSFDPNKPSKKERHKNGGVGASIKKFATIGILILVVSLTYKYMFNIKTVVLDFLSSATQDALGSKKNTNVKSKGTGKAKATDNKPQKMELRDVRFYEKENKAGQYKDLKVEGIFFDPSGKSFVTINGKVLSEGENIGDVKIEKIYSDSVELKVKGETKVLGVNQSMPFEAQNTEETMTGKNVNKKQAVPSICELPLNDEDLKKLLTPEQYRITRQNGTETAFNNEYWNNKHQGIYVDIVSGEPLFSSTDKFDSETGWPSFTVPIDKDNIVERKDSSSGMVRTEVRSKNSNSHLGHLFEDGPEPTGLRYCINSAVLRFIPVEDLEREGYRGYAYLFTKPENEIAVFGAGCFWGVQSILSELDGVIKVTAGYMGGITKNPTYEDVCTDKTGHAEAVEVEYDPKKISYQQLLDTFWNIHDPTAVNRQGPDVGTQYRSIIFYYTLEQKKAAEASKISLKDKFKEPIATEILAARAFYKAEEYHQDYFKKHNLKSTCSIPLKKK